MSRKACVIRRGIAILVLVTTTAQGCTSWVRVAPDREDVLQGKTFALRVTTRDSVVRTLYSTQFTSDRLIGSRIYLDQGIAIPPAFAVSIPRADIQSIDVQRPDAGRSALLVLGVTGTVLLILAAMIASTPIDWSSSSSGNCIMCLVP